MSEHSPQQPTLPTLEDFGTVSWLTVEKQKRKRLGGLLGSKTVTNVLSEESGLPKRETIRADDIAAVTDPNLRYALRFAAAMQAIGLQQTSPFTYSAHTVHIEATGEGTDSTLVAAYYSGAPGAFEEALRSQEPTYENN